MATCRGCGQELTDVSGRGVHPTPKCDRKTPEGQWWMPPEELDELATRYWPTATTPPSPEAQEAEPK